ncbi:MAG: hypothetical protein J6J60_00725 [Clostridia bacterium]|nr:hypothetical protein [Clostridia bacterium]
MEETKKYRKYIYISKKVQPIIEEYCNNNNITLVTRFINEYNLEKFMQTELRNLNSVDYLIIDLNAVENLTEDNEIISKITLIRRMYNLRVIILAEGYKHGNILLGKIFNLGIYNIITATDEQKFKEELKKVLSAEGMTFGNSIKYKVDSQIIAVNQTTKLVKENFIKVKQTVSIGVIGTEKHIGATTAAINLTKYLSELTNIKACYIENNNHNTIVNIAEFKEAIYTENLDKIKYKGIDLFLKPKNMSDILSNNYNFYVYDYGALNEITEEEKMSFLTRDLKLIVTGNKIWEIPNLINCFQIIGEDINTYLMFNFAKESEKENFRISLGEYWKERATYSEYITDPFEVGNKYFYETILKPYLINTDVTEKKKKFDFFRKRGKK